MEGRKRNADATDFGRDSANDHLWGCDASFQVWGVFDLVLGCLLKTGVMMGEWESEQESE